MFFCSAPDLLLSTRCKERLWMARTAYRLLAVACGQGGGSGSDGESYIRGTIVTHTAPAGVVVGSRDSFPWSGCVCLPGFGSVIWSGIVSSNTASAGAVIARPAPPRLLRLQRSSLLHKSRVNQHTLVLNHLPCRNKASPTI